MRDQDNDGTPQPASQPMTKEQADFLFKQTKGQLVPYLAEDGKWYVYQAKPVELPSGMPAVRR